MSFGPNPTRTLGDRFRRFATRASERFGSPWAFVVSVLVVFAWLVSGPIFHFSNGWQLVIHTANETGTEVPG